MAASPHVSLVDDDASVRDSLPDLLQMRGFAVEAFESAENFLASSALNLTQCLILDVSMPGMSGPELQQELTNRRRDIPIIFITAKADPSLFGRLLDRGAVDCLVKPFSDRDLRRALDSALLL
jgi:FixJ family two-component response regulator